MDREGKVYIVGAGPGDPKLLTLKGKDCLEMADVVIYDYLANEMLLSHVRVSAEKIYVGKKTREKIYSQEGINELMISRAREGKIVTRLKGGDPFVFGRGGEEAEELAKAGIPFEIVPGVTSAIAAPAYAGIPLTHRDYTSTVAFITGQEDPTRESKIAWDRIATAAGTLVFFMGSQNLSFIINKLLENGRNQRTPIALIRWGTRADQKTIVGNLGDIINRAEEGGFGPPGIVVVGDVVKLRGRLSWFEKRPLFGRRIIVTRPKGQSREFSETLQLYGAEVIEFPTIEIVPPKSWRDMDRAISDIEGYDWIIFTSRYGVKYFFRRLNIIGLDSRELKNIKIAVIGNSTRERLESFGIIADLVPQNESSHGLLKEFAKIDIRDRKIFLPRSDLSDKGLTEGLKKLGAKVAASVCYKNVMPNALPYLDLNAFDGIMFTSPSGVRNFTKRYGNKIPKKTKVSCIGEVTLKEAKKFCLIR